MEKRRQQYRKILKKDPILYEVSEKLYSELSDAGWGMENTAACIVPVYVMAPVMLRFILWVLENAVSRGQERLYFLARDGYSMYRAAEKICRWKKLPVECRYLYCSRYAWRSAQYWLKEKESLEYICLGGIDVTFERIMQRAGLTAQEARRTADITGYGGNFSQVLGYGQIQALKPRLAECSFFMDRLMVHSKEKYPAVMGYLEQEGLYENVSYALVDSGWTGSMQKTLTHLLQSAGVEKEPEGYYFGMYEYPEAMPQKLYHPYYFQPDNYLRRKVYFNNNLFECMFSAPEGMTVGYQEKRGRYVPVLEQKENPNQARILKNIDCLLTYTDMYIRDNKGKSNGEGRAVQEKAAGSKGLRNLENGLQNGARRAALRSVKNSKRLLSNFMGHPAPEEAEEFGSYIFCDDVLGEGRCTVAGDLSYEDIKALQLLSGKGRLFCRNKKTLHESAWLEGSTVLEKKTNSWDMRQVALLKYAIYIRKMMK